MTVHVFVLAGYITAALGCLAAIGKALHWAYLKVRAVDDTFTFVEQMKTNHLPHIHDCLKLIATKMGIELPKD